MPRDWHRRCADSGPAPFKGLAHRVEYVESVNGVAYYDDSKGTNVGATVAALNGMLQPVVLIAGGDGKGQDFAPLLPAVERICRAVVLIGRDGPAAARGFICGPGCRYWMPPPCRLRLSWQPAQAQSGDVVLMSPACASLDMFRNYAHRAEVFVAAVKICRERMDDCLGTKTLRRLRKTRPASTYDQAVVWITLVLLTIGLVMVYSSSIAMAEGDKDTGQGHLFSDSPCDFPGGGADRRGHGVFRCRCGCGSNTRRICS